MRASAVLLLVAVSVAALAAAVPCARADAASVCAAQAASQAEKGSAKPGWVLDHYVRSAAQGREWAVMADCNHPGAPERMRLVPGWRGQPAAKSLVRRVAAGADSAPTMAPAPPVVIRAGAPVVVVNAPGAAVAMNLAGVAVSSAQAGQVIRVRLEAFHALVSGVVRGPGTVELVAAVQPQWGQP